LTAVDGVVFTVGMDLEISILRSGLYAHNC
jgi:hypothetical protein